MSCLIYVVWFSEYIQFVFLLFVFIYLFFYIKGVLKRRDQIQSELDSKVDALASKKADKDLVSMSLYRMLKYSRPYSNCRK